MTRPRAALVSVADTPYYHCIGRCVRRAFLCGEDVVTGRSFSHRRQWMLDRLAELTETFAIDLCAYALMSNHYHLVVRIDSARAETWSSREVVERWVRIFRGPKWARRYLEDKPLSETEQGLLNHQLPIWRARLSDLSWFMRGLNEWVARRANIEDECKGRFWEGRFKSQALLDNTALLTAMAYVDLNPIRAGLADSPIDADFTSLQQRLFERAQEKSEPVEAKPVEAPSPSEPKPALMPFADAVRADEGPIVPFAMKDYIELVDTSSRLVRERKQGAIPASAPDLSTILGVEPEQWFKSVTERPSRFDNFIGSPALLREIAEQRGWHWIRGIGASKRLYIHPDD